MFIDSPIHPTLSRASVAAVAVCTSLSVACSSPSPDPGPGTAEPVEPVSGGGAELPAEEIVCGPQAPRDLSEAGGTNTVPVPVGDTPHLCNVHFHAPWEHAGLMWDGETPEPSGQPVCESVDYGQKVEFHWVYTNCEPPEPSKPGLENCVCDRPDMVLRVFGEAYVVGQEGGEPEQPTEGLVRYHGSTTGTAYDDESCSPARVNWGVKREVEKISKSALGEWCETTPWEGEGRPHGARGPVTREDWLAPYTPP